MSVSRDHRMPWTLSWSASEATDAWPNDRVTRRVWIWVSSSTRSVSNSRSRHPKTQQRKRSSAPQGIPFFSDQGSLGLRHRRPDHHRRADLLLRGARHPKFVAARTGLGHVGPGLDSHGSYWIRLRQVLQIMSSALGPLGYEGTGPPPNPALQRTWPAATGSSGASSPRRRARVWCVFADSTHPTTLEPVVRPEGPRNCEVVPWRGIVERTCTELGRSRRSSTDDEGRAESSASWISSAMTPLMFRRLEPVLLCRSLHPRRAWHADRRGSLTWQAGGSSVKSTGRWGKIP